jgi:hypothetical protein
MTMASLIVNENDTNAVRDQSPLLVTFSVSWKKQDIGSFRPASPFISVDLTGYLPAIH